MKAFLWCVLLIVSRIAYGDTVGSAVLCDGKVFVPAFEPTATVKRTANLDALFKQEFRHDNVQVTDDLVVRLKNLLRAEFAAEEPWLRTFGDILQHLRNQENRQNIIDAWDTLTKHSAIYARMRSCLPAFLNDTKYRKSSQRWGDGFYFRDIVVRRDSCSGYVEVLAEQTDDEELPFCQGATLVFFEEPLEEADDAMTRVKAVERTLYKYKDWDDVRVPFARVSLDNGVLHLGSRDASAVFTLTYELAGMAEKPFSLTHFESFDDDDHWVTSWYCSAGALFEWLWGFDVYMPIYDTQGKFVALLAVTTLTCQPGNCRQIIRENLGNFAKRAEDPD